MGKVFYFGYMESYRFESNKVKLKKVEATEPDFSGEKRNLCRGDAFLS